MASFFVVSMQRKELYEVVGGAWSELSRFRGWTVQKDAPVCIHVARIIHRNIPNSTLIKMAVPERDDFEAVVLTPVDGALSVVDAAHRVWMKTVPRVEPSLVEATLILPVTTNLNFRTHLPYARQLQQPYVSAMKRLIEHIARYGTKGLSTER